MFTDSTYGFHTSFYQQGIITYGMQLVIFKRERESWVIYEQNFKWRWKNRFSVSIWNGLMSLLASKLIITFKNDFCIHLMELQWNDSVWIAKISSKIIAEVYYQQLETYTRLLENSINQQKRVILQHDNARTYERKTFKKENEMKQQRWEIFTIIYKPYQMYRA